MPSGHTVAGTGQEPKAQLGSVLSAQVSRHEPKQVTPEQGNVEQSKAQVLKASQVAVQLPPPQVKSQVLPPAQWHVWPEQSPSQWGLDPWQSTLQLPTLPQVKSHVACTPQVQSSPLHAAVQVLPASQVAGQSPFAQESAQVQPCGQVQALPEQVSWQHWPALQAVSVEQSVVQPPPAPPVPLDEALLDDEEVVDEELVDDEVVVDEELVDVALVDVVLLEEVDVVLLVAVALVVLVPDVPPAPPVVVKTDAPPSPGTPEEPQPCGTPAAIARSTAAAKAAAPVRACRRRSNAIRRSIAQPRPSAAGVAAGRGPVTPYA